MKKSLLKYKKHYLKLIFAIVILFIFLKIAKIKDYSIILNSLNDKLFWFACILLVIVQIVKAIRFHILISEYKIRISFFKNLIIHFIVPILGLLTPSKLGEGAKLIMINQKKDKVGFCFILEKLIDLLVLFVLGFIGMYNFTIFISSIYIIIIVIIVIIIWLIYFDRIFNFLFKKFLKNKLEKNWFLLNFKLFLKPKYIITLLLGILVWALNIYAAYNFSLIAGFKISFINFAPIFASSILVGLISGFPGGIGSREATIGFLFFRIFKIDLKTGGIFSILNLFGNYFTFTIIGLLGYITLKLMFKLEKRDNEFS